MVRIVKIGNSVEINIDGKRTIHPRGTLTTHIDDKSNSVDIKYRASRRTSYSFSYKDLEEPEATSPKNAQDLIALLLE